MPFSKYEDALCRSLKVSGNSELQGALSVASTLTAGASSFARVIQRNAVPLTSTAAGEPGEYACNSASAFAYFCLASNTWQRVALSNTAFN